MLYMFDVKIFFIYFFFNGRLLKMVTVGPRNNKHLFKKSVVLIASIIVLRKLGEDSKTLYRKVGETSTKLITFLFK